MSSASPLREPLTEGLEALWLRNHMLPPPRSGFIGAMFLFMCVMVGKVGAEQMTHGGVEVVLWWEGDAADASSIDPGHCGLGVTFERMFMCGHLRTDASEIGWHYVQFVEWVNVV